MPTPVLSNLLQGVESEIQGNCNPFCYKLLCLNRNRMMFKDFCRYLLNHRVTKGINNDTDNWDIF